MKKFILFSVLLFASCSNLKLTGGNKMKLYSPGVSKGLINQKYGKNGNDFKDNMPSLSIPLEWENAPKNTKEFILVMEDNDSIPVVGFSWIHWVVSIPQNYNELKENSSRKNSELVQGSNSWITSQGGELDRKKASFYGGPAPPDKDHIYTFKLYALDKRLDLKNGFYLNEVYNKIDGHILGKATLKAKYKK